MALKYGALHNWSKVISGGWWFKCISRIFNAGYFLYNIYCSVQLMQNTARVTVGGFGSHRNLESLAITVQECAMHTKKKKMLSCVHIQEHEPNQELLFHHPHLLCQCVSFLKTAALHILIIFPADNQYKTELYSLYFPEQFIFHTPISAIHTDFIFHVNQRPSTCRTGLSISTGNISANFQEFPS